ncbi:MAG: hypothetical protein R6W48_00815 [Gaiellaceae bacterium]
MRIDLALILVGEGGLPGDGIILTATFVTVGLSILAHGATAALPAARYAGWIGRIRLRRTRLRSRTRATRFTGGWGSPIRGSLFQETSE